MEAPEDRPRNIANHAKEPRQTEEDDLDAHGGRALDLSTDAFQVAFDITRLGVNLSDRNVQGFHFLFWVSL